MKIGSGYAAWLGKAAKPGSLPPMARSWWRETVEGRVRGVRGETPLHWALASGDAARAKAWLAAGGGFEADSQGCAPIHWLASAASLKEFKAILDDSDARSALDPEWERQDASGRDALGIIALERDLEKLGLALEWRSQALVSIGVGEPVGLCDALVAQGARLGWNAASSRVEYLLGKYGVAGPSQDMPAAFAGGVWTQSLWSVAAKNFKTPALRAWEQARELDGLVASARDVVGLAPAKRI